MVKYWIIVNNIDSNRDIYFINNTICIDATNKNKMDNFDRRWPDDVDCTPSVLDSLQKRGIIDISAEFKKKYQL